ncbi:hypothetical protein [Rhizobium binae]|uniref:hypothetical protein n=1 Tax=Rhizobium binae TaxID=1138190 RepID=UPI001C835F14|nr:hypothetical protein [Rhizobium binae]MBX4925972.1 hypothetical protein [Rhizobium binae]MBX4938662.1 hypothetical protein [Rhizobium binae]MBX4943838.1 hypothetical protein [Rhizobium binae]MBX4962500.1 hypothetical protein [Rhizobium binae]MBX4979009.1 hypothetical protein [Rhizobium binae]
MPDIKGLFKRAELQIFLVYMGAHLPIFLLSDARYWDDWSLSGASKEMLVSVFTQAGFPLLGYYHYAVQLIGWWFYAFSTFALGYFIIHVFYLILKSFDFSKSDAKSLSFLAATLPLNFARIAAINNPGLFFLLIFVFALYVFVNSVSNKNILAEYISYALFIFSFQFNALIPFFLVVFFIAAFLFHTDVDASTDPIHHKNYINKFRYVTRKTGVIVLLPFLYAVIQHFLFKKSGMFSAQYNVIDIDFGTIISEIKVIILYLFPYNGIYVGNTVTLTIFISTLLSVYLIRSNPTVSGTDAQRNGKGLICIGVALLSLGASAYVLVGKDPSYEPWTATRFQVLLPFGAAFSTLGLLKVICTVFPAENPDIRHRMKVASFGGLIAVFIVNWWFVYATFYVDHLRQEAFADTIRNTPSLQSRNYVILDRSGLNAFDTMPGLGEYAGLHEAATGKHDALILDYDTVTAHGSWSAFVGNAKKFLGPWSKVEDAAFNVPGCLYIVNRGHEVQSTWSYAMSALIIKTRNPEHYTARQLLSFDGPYCQSPQ